MNRYYDSRFEKECINIAPGEFYVTREDIIISTILGSCVGVAFFDPILKIGGLNHFMLSEAKNISKIESYIKIERYGLYAMEAVINDMLKRGCFKKNLRAKVFGGSLILDGGGKMDIGTNNIRFAFEYLETEKIPVDRKDIGGKLPRRLYFFPVTFKVLVQNVRGDSTNLYRQMDEYLKEAEKKKSVRIDPVLFDQNNN